MKQRVNEARMFKMRRDGYSLNQIAKAMRLKPSLVRLRLLRHGKFPGRVPLKGQLSKEEIRVIFSMHKKGHSLRAIGKAIGSSFERVRVFLKKRGRSSVASVVYAANRARRHCVIKNCKQDPKAHGYCFTHWNRVRRGRMDKKGNLIPVQRFCTNCGREFYSPPEPGTARQCKRCRRIRAKS